MCKAPKVKVPKQNIPEPTTPAPPPPAPEPSAPPPAPPVSAAADNPYAEQGEYTRRNQKKKKGRSGLRIDLSTGNASAGATGINIPQG